MVKWMWWATRRCEPRDGSNQGSTVQAGVAGVGATCVSWFVFDGVSNGQIGDARKGPYEVSER